MYPAEITVIPLFLFFFPVSFDGIATKSTSILQDVITTSLPFVFRIARVIPT